MKLNEFNYKLPSKFIAQYPLKDRSSSKLMVIRKKENFSEKQFFEIIDFFKAGDVLVVNDSKVIPAKITGCKDTGGSVEILLVSKIIKDRFLCLIKGRNIKPDTLIIIKDNYKARVVEKIGDKFIVQFSHNIDFNLIGDMPTPPYVKTKLKEKDRYQTIYANNNKIGSIAAPTAGFHFTTDLLDQIKKKGVKIVKVTLHVSLGTFLPVLSEDITKHKMHEETFEISKRNADIINNLVKDGKGRLFVVGTTSLKALESASDKNGFIKPQKSQSDIFIYPGYNFKVKTYALITNFHLPQSTLLMLVTAFVQSRGYQKNSILMAYEEAKKKNFRFYSFGDSMIIF